MTPVDGQYARRIETVLRTRWATSSELGALVGCQPKIARWCIGMLAGSMFVLARYRDVDGRGRPREYRIPRECFSVRAARVGEVREAPRTHPRRQPNHRERPDVR